MRVGIISVHVDYHRRGQRRRFAMQPQIGSLLAGLLPRDIDIEIVNETWQEPDWSKEYDLLFLSCMHSDFDRARQISHYWRRRGAKTVLGGSFASSYPNLCQPYFDAVAVGDPEGMIGNIYRDFCDSALQPLYMSTDYDGVAVATPRFDLVVNQSAHTLCFEATRGCPFLCEFCVLTGLGTRHHTRPVAAVLRDIVDGQALLRKHVPRYQRNIVGFCDNNIGGDLAYLRELCQALTPLKLQWYGAATFNVVANREIVRLLARSGCRALYVGLESFNPATIDAMHKHQNVLHKIKATIDNCRDHGILIVSGLMVSPLTDDVGYIRRIAAYLRDCGMHMPTFICFETPIPGTPHFLRLASEARTPFLPNALLRDFSGYTLVVQPRLNSTHEFLDAYRATLRDVYSLRNKVRKLAEDVPRFLKRGYWLPALIDGIDVFAANPIPAADRSLLAETDTPPPERVPLTEADFESAEQQRQIMTPSRVTDAEGRVLNAWLHPNKVFDSEREKVARHQRRAGGKV